MRMRTVAVILLALVSIAGATTCRNRPGQPGRTTTTPPPTAEPGTPIPAPVRDNCITNVSAGDRSFSCDGVNYLVTVGDNCTRFACGLIVDVHGALMSGQVQREATRLHQLAPPRGYLVVHPSAPSGTWNLQTDPPKIADFMTRMINAFHVDTKRVHVTGFSMGSATTFWFLCNKPDLLASAAPVTGSSAEQVRNVATGGSCLESIDAGWQPRVPILFMSGTVGRGAEHHRRPGPHPGDRHPARPVRPADGGAATPPTAASDGRAPTGWCSTSSSTTTRTR